MKLVVDGRTFPIGDPAEFVTSLSFEEQDLVEAIFGKPVEDLGRMKMVGAFYVVAKFRADGAVDINAIKKMRPLAEIEVADEDDEPADEASPLEVNDVGVVAPQ